MVANVCNPSTWEAGAEELQEVHHQPGLQEFQESLSYYIARSCLKNRPQNKKKHF